MIWVPYFEKHPFERITVKISETCIPKLTFFKSPDYWHKAAGLHTSPHHCTQYWLISLWHQQIRVIYCLSSWRLMMPRMLMTMRSPTPRNHQLTLFVCISRFVFLDHRLLNNNVHHQFVDFQMLLRPQLNPKLRSFLCCCCSFGARYWRCRWSQKLHWEQRPATKSSRDHRNLALTFRNPEYELVRHLYLHFPEGNHDIL